MKNKIRFVTFYPKCHNAGLMKDVGQIPNVLGNNYGDIESKLVSCILDLSDDNIKQLKGMEIENIPWVLNNDFLTGIKYILKNARNIEWLNLFHGGRKCYYWTRLYKFLNPKGKVYLKLDLGPKLCEKYAESERELEILERVLKVVDIASVESEKIKKTINQLTSLPVELIPNGYITVEDDLIKETVREKQFVTVGRLGTLEKATDILLEAFAKSSTEHDWNLKLVGPIEDEFRPEIEKFYKTYPELKDRVTFTGPVYDRAALYAEYRSARTFVLPSRWEASPLVGPEALYNGCRMILSDIIPPIKELTGDLQFGRVVETGSVESLKMALIAETKMSYSDEMAESISAYAENTLSWESVCGRLHKKILEIE